MAVPYIFASLPNGTAIPLSYLDADFSYLATSPSFTGNVSITGTLGVGGATTLSSTLGVTGSATFLSSITVTDSSGSNGGQLVSILQTSTAAANYGVVITAAGTGSGVNTAIYANAYGAATNIGIRVPNPPAGANNYGIFVDAAQSYFGGNVGIGTSSPSYKLSLTTSQILAAQVVSNNANETFTLGIRAPTDGASSARCDIQFNTTTGTSGSNSYMSFWTNTYGISYAERMRIDSSGNTYIEAGNLWQYAPAPTSISTTATLTAAQLQTDIINTTGTSYTVTTPTGTAIDAGFTGVPTTNIGFDFHIVNTASGTITMAVNTGVTSLGTLTVATGVSAHFRLRRTAANTYVMYRLS